MLAATVDDINQLPYPLLATPKIDGIRCLVVNGHAVTRNFKPLPNRYVREMISQCPTGFDGEVIVPGKAFNEISSAIMSEEGTPDFRYLVFDYYVGSMPYFKRMQLLKQTPAPSFVKKLIPIQVNSPSELRTFEKECLANGYEGVMVRTPDSPYKMGRATLRSGYLLKLKRFKQDEAKIIDIIEGESNQNVAQKDVFGHTIRQSLQAGIVKTGTMGALVVRDLKTHQKFQIGSGFDYSLRDEIWKHKDRYIGKIVTYKHQTHGSKDLPRFPIFVGFRDVRDM